MKHILIITVLILIAQFRVLTYKYVSDDLPVYKNPPKSKNKAHKLFLWLTGALRWLPKYDHLLTMGIHILVCWGIYFAFGRNWQAFMAATLFAIHPAGMHGSVWISGRAYAMTALFVVWALAIGYPYGAPLLWAAGYYTAGIPAPMALIGSAHWKLIGFLPLVWLCWQKKFRKAVSNKAGGERAKEDYTFGWHKIVLFIKTIGFYLALAIWPHKVTFYHYFLQSCAGSQKDKAYSLCKYFWIGLSAIIGWAAYSYSHWDMISYGLLWFFIGIAPFGNLMRIQQEISERFLYFPMIGVMAALAYALAPWPGVLLILAGFYYGRLHSVLVTFRDDFWVVEASVQEDPYAWYGWHIRAIKRWDARSFHEAATFWIIARSHSPKEFKLLYNLALVFKVIKQMPQYEMMFKEAEANIIPGQEAQAREMLDRLKNNQPVQMLI